jgi:hypothetical protein
MISFHIIFDVKHDLRHEAKLVAGGNWTVINKEDIYLRNNGMDFIWIGFS